jgi:hypothetical protein
MACPAIPDVALRAGTAKAHGVYGDARPISIIAERQPERRRSQLLDAAGARGAEADRKAAAHRCATLIRDDEPGRPEGVMPQGVPPLPVAGAVRSQRWSASSDSSAMAYSSAGRLSVSRTAAVSREILLQRQLVDASHPGTSSPSWRPAAFCSKNQTAPNRSSLLPQPGKRLRNHVIERGEEP